MLCFENVAKVHQPLGVTGIKPHRYYFTKATEEYAKTAFAFIILYI